MHFSFHFALIQLRTITQVTVSLLSSLPICVTVTCEKDAFGQISEEKRIKTLGFFFHLNTSFAQRRRVCAQRRQSAGKSNTLDEGERSLDVSAIIDSQRRNKFTRLETLLKLLFVAPSE